MRSKYMFQFVLLVVFVLCGSRVRAADPYSFDIAGDWKMTYGYAVGLPLVSPRTYGVHFDVTGPGERGGVKFRGRYTEPAGQAGTFTGETFFTGRGVYLLEMRVTDSPSKYFEVLCGKHHVDPSKVMVIGGWSNVGYAEGPGGQGYLGNFEMVKVK